MRLPRRVKTLYQFRKYLEKCGWEIPDYCVYVKDDRAIKMGYDTAWLDYIIWANSARRRRKFAPRLYDIRWFPKEPNGWNISFAAEMERVPYKSDHNWDFRELLGKVRYEPTRFPELEPHAPGIATFLTELFSRYADDLHYGNYGFRADGSLCIYDPTTRKLDNTADKLFITKPVVRNGKIILQSRNL